MQDYKSLCAAVTICATVVNIQTDIDRHTQRDTQSTDSILHAYMNSTSSRAKMIRRNRLSDFEHDVRAYMIDYHHHNHHHSGVMFRLMSTTKN